MQTFLSQVAQAIIKNNPNSLGETIVVLPSRRAIVFLREEFKKQLAETTWLPQFYSLEDFVVNLGEFQQLDRIDLIFELYEIHKKIEQSNAEPFHEFLTWGNLLLQDFNEIDRYLVDGSALFGFLTEAKAIEKWNLTGEPLSEFQHKYLNFFRKLSDYYEQFKARLIEKNQFYQGLGFRRVAEMLEEGKLKTAHISTIYFAGFNALTAAEEKILNYFKAEKKAQLFWDADEYYLSDPHQEAGNFLRTHKKKEEQAFNWLSNNLAKGEKQVDIYGISGNIGQAKLIGNLLKDEHKASYSSTAVVLSDEELLLATLEAIPTSIDKINVTMGYPVKSSPFYFWIETYFKLFKGLSTASNTKGFYFHEVKYFLTHPVLGYLSKPKATAIANCLKEIEVSRAIFVTSDAFKPLEQSLQINLFKDYSHEIPELLKITSQLIDLVRKEGESVLSDLDREILYYLSSSFKRLQELVNSHSIDFSIDSILILFKEIVGTESVSFIGEPLGGLQIMGVLESRTLDFEQVIISSVNEGVLPSGKTQNSFIPFDIKLKFNLPSYKEKDSIFAYHFYRLLQRANKVSILYNTKVDQLQGGERSRFIEQLLHEMPNKNSAITINHHVVAPDLLEERETVVSIEKNQEIISKVENHLKNGFSPSALNTYLSCPLDYYYKYILGLKEKEDLEEKIEDSTFGTIIHNVLEELYSPMLGKLMDKKALEVAKKALEHCLNKAYVNELNVEPTSGNHKLSFEVAKQLILNLIQHDLNQLSSGHEIHLISLEEPFKQAIELKLSENSKKEICLKGKIDRVDRINGTKRIIDYKTGATSATDLAYSDLSGVLKGNKSKAVQMMMYKASYEQQYKSESVDAGIISLRNLSSGFIPLKENNSMEEDLTTILKTVVNELLSPDYPFQHEPSAEYCGFCSNKKEVFT